MPVLSTFKLNTIIHKTNKYHQITQSVPKTSEGKGYIDITKLLKKYKK